MTSSDPRGGWLPPVAELLNLPAELKQAIPPEYEDLNGHMNIKHYFELQSFAAWGVFRRVGYEDERRPDEGAFTLEQHLRYHNEVLVGQEVSAHVVLLDRSDKVVHGISFLVNRTTDQVANTLEFVSAHVDLTQRRISPFPTRIADALDAELARCAHLGDVESPGPARLRS
ncbi:thioesterase family protein [Haloechinothrix halophila]|uniref:thioesterase family protein n=1 Tax=Haloechinothrix halophila TaxID=1069073 RepID=UPI0004062D8B|nr:thioesterase family protein [Haloechinothrix halophila]